MISTRIVGLLVVGVLVVGLLVGAAGSVLLSRSSTPASGGSYYGRMGNGSGPGMMGGRSGYGMMGGGSWSYDDMLNEMRERMGWAPDASAAPSQGAGQ